MPPGSVVVTASKATTSPVEVFAIRTIGTSLNLTESTDCADEKAQRNNPGMESAYLSKFTPLWQSAHTSCKLYLHLSEFVTNLFGARPRVQADGLGVRNT